mgnify:CR=1 FL=1
MFPNGYLITDKTSMQAPYTSLGFNWGGINVIMIFTSEIVRCNVPNKNGHVYTKECIEKALENPVIKEQIETGCFFGGFMEDCREDLSIDISKISHVCKELWWEDNTLYGKFETLNTPKGMTLTEMLNKWTKNSYSRKS